MGLPHPAAVQQARQRMQDGTATTADALAIVRQSVGISRAWAAADVGGTQNLTGANLAGRCAMARDLTAFSMAAQLEGTGVQSTIRRYSVDGLIQANSGQGHQFTIVEFRFPNGRMERFIVDPTFAQFVSIGGDIQPGKEADRARDRIGSAETVARLLEDGFIPLNRSTAKIYLDALVPPGYAKIDPRLLLTGAGGLAGDPTGERSRLTLGPDQRPLAEQLNKQQQVEFELDYIREAADQLRGMGRNDLAHEIDELGHNLGRQKFDDERAPDPDVSNQIDE
jgi:hypothetical protein